MALGCCSINREQGDKVDIGKTATILASISTLTGLLITLFVWSYFIREWKPKDAFLKYIRLSFYPMLIFIFHITTEITSAIIRYFIGVNTVQITIKTISNNFSAGIGAYLFSLIVVLPFFAYANRNAEKQDTNTNFHANTTNVNNDDIAICYRCKSEYEKSVTFC
jgi:hypothetical protein